MSLGTKMRLVGPPPMFCLRCTLVCECVVFQTFYQGCKYIYIMRCFVVARSSQDVGALTSGISRICDLFWVSSVPSKFTAVCHVFGVLIILFPFEIWKSGVKKKENSVCQIYCVVRTFPRGFFLEKQNRNCIYSLPYCRYFMLCYVLYNWM